MFRSYYGEVQLPRNYSASNVLADSNIKAGTGLPAPSSQRGGPRVYTGRSTLFRCGCASPGVLRSGLSLLVTHTAYLVKSMLNFEERIYIYIYK